jgi:hypothetical protein
VDFLQLRQHDGAFIDFGTTPAATGLQHLQSIGGRSMKTGKTPILMLATLMFCLACNNLRAATYEVGPSKPLTAIGQVSGILEAGVETRVSRMQRVS